MTSAKMQHSKILTIALILMACSVAHGIKKKRYQNLKAHVDGLELKLNAIAAAMQNGSANFNNKLDSMWDSCGCAAPAPVCPEGWWQFNNLCYFWVKELLNWKDAAAHCVELGGYMAVPNDHEEDVFISDMVASYNLAPWLGASDLQEEGVWRSVVDNEPLYYVNWLHSNDLEPNGGTRENCLDFKIVSGKAYWNDASCDTPLNAICEIVL